MRRSRTHILAAVLLALAATAPARAALQWYQDYEQGLEAAEHRDWATALGHFQEAARTRREPAARVRTYGAQFLFDYDPLFQQARCLTELGRLEEARRLLREAEEAAVTDAATLAALRERLRAQADRASRTATAGERAAADARTGTEEAAPTPDAVLAVRSAPGGASVVVDGRTVGVTPLAGMDVPPGRHRVELRLAGTEPWAEAVELEPGERLQLDVTLARVRPGGETAAAPGAGPPPATVPVVNRAGDRVPASTPSASAPSGAETTAPEPLDSRREGSLPPIEDGAGEEAAADRPAPAGPPPPTPPERRLPGGWAAVAGAGLLITLAGVLALTLGAAARSRRRRSPRSRELPGRIGRYRVTGELGRGGMAATYRAVRARDGLPVALKIPHESGDPTYLPRFLREGRLGETLHHPRIVRIVEAGEEDGRPFLAMELIPGRTLRDALDAAGGPFPLRRALEIARDVAEALDYAHGKGVVHRDLKPENVMLLPDGSVKVMDFGVARVEGQPGLTTSSFFFGSPVYAAPELIDPSSIDHRADLYSLGVVLFELLEGRPPFHHESVFKLLELHQREPLPAPETLPNPLPDAVWEILRRLLAKDPAQRHPGAQQLLVDLERLLNELPG